MMNFGNSMLGAMAVTPQKTKTWVDPSSQLMAPVSLPQRSAGGNTVANTSIGPRQMLMETPNRTMMPVGGRQNIMPAATGPMDSGLNPMLFRQQNLGMQQPYGGSYYNPFIGSGFWNQG